MAAKLYNHAEGKWQDVPDDQVDDLIRAGTHTFETGIDIPVVSPDGELGSVKSDKLYDAFKDGFRWQTQADRDSDYDIQQARIKKDNFDNAGEAFAGGVLRGATLGASDVAIPAIASAFGGDYNDVKEGLKTNKETSPWASTGGALTGIAATAGLGGVAKGGQAAYDIGAGAAEGLTGALGTSRAAKAIQTVAESTLGSAAEGAYYGLGEGISEAALGKPEDVVNNLAAGVGLGALSGGAFGAALLGPGKVAAPYLTKAFEMAGDKVGGLVNKVARKVEVKGVTAALNNAGEEKLATEYAAMMKNPETAEVARNMAMNGEWDKLQAVQKEILKSQALFEAEQKDLRAGLDSYFKSATGAEKAVMDDALRQSGGDAWAARKGIYKQIQQKSDAFRNGVSQFEDLADVGRVAQHSAALDDTAARLAKIGTPEAKRWSKQLSSYNARNFIGTGQGITEAEEFTALDNLKRNVIDYDRDVKKLADGRVRKELKDLWSYAKNQLTSEKSGIREEIKAFSRDLDTDYTAYNALGNLLGGKVLRKSALSQLAADPAKLDAIEPLFKNYKDFVPELQALKTAANNAGNRAEIIGKIRAKISDMKLRSVNGDLSIEDLDRIISDSGFLVGNPMQRVKKLEEVSKFLQQADNASPLERAVMLERQLKGGPSQLEKYLPYQQNLETFSKVMNTKVPGDSFSWGKVGGSIGYVLGGSMGARVGGALGAIAGATKTDPINIMRGLSKIERTMQTGISGLQKASKGAVSALTSNKFKTGVVAYNALKPDRKRFQEVSSNIKKMVSGGAMMDTLAQMPASHVPGVHQALAVKLSTAANYLHTHLPEDPTASYSIFPDKSKWTPSDLDLAKFQRRCEVVNDPTVAINRIAEGTVTAEQVDALKNVYPEIFSSLQQDIISGIMESKEPPAYKSRLILAQVFGIPTNLSMTPNFIQTMQASFQQQDQGGRPTGAPDQQPRSRGKAQSSIDIKPMESIATDAQNVTFKTDIH